MKSTIKNRILLIVWVLLMANSSLLAQYSLNNSATVIGNQVFQLTANTYNQSGSVWYKYMLDLTKPFTVSGQLYFGSNPTGADGICFVMQNQCLNAGTFGGGIGYGALPGQSMAVEFDTYQNCATCGGNQDNLDPTYDHIAIEDNGNVNHGNAANTIAAPVQMSPTNANVKDGLWHNYKITWNPGTTTMEVFFDDMAIPRISTVYNVLTNVFGGQPYFYFGFTSSTGGAYSPNSVSIDPFLSNAMNPVTICPGNCTEVDQTATTISDANYAQADSAVSTPTLNGSAPTAPQGNDGSLTSRWVASTNGDNEYYQLDKKVPFLLKDVAIYWETAYSKNYDIQTSLDGITWTTVASMVNSSGTKVLKNGIYYIIDSFHIVTPVITNFVRMQSSLKGTGYSLSIWEMRTYGHALHIWTPTANITPLDAGIITPTGVITEHPKFCPPASTTYTVTTQDKCGGLIVDHLKVTVGPCGCLPFIVDTTVVHNLCNGAKKGSVKVNTDGVDPDVIFSIDGKQTWKYSSTFSGLAAGTYKIYARDTKNCLDSTTVTITEPIPLTLTVTTTTIPCSGNNGTATAIPVGGTLIPVVNYTYKWSDASAQTVIKAVGLSAKNYTVTVTDANNCTVSTTATVSSLNGFTAKVTGLKLNCNGDFGSLTAIPTPASVNYTYKWNDVATQTTVTATNLVLASNLATKSYKVVVTDAVSGCTASATAIISQPTLITLKVNDSSVSCNGDPGALKAQVSGGIVAGAYKYSWSDLSSLQIATNLILPSGTTSLPYTVTVTDDNGCTMTKTANLTQPTQLQLIVNDSSISCYGLTNGALKAQPSGGNLGYLYNWSSGSTTQTPTNLTVTGTTTNYTVTVTDAKGCSITKSANLSQPTPMQLIVNDSSINCNGASGALKAEPSGGKVVGAYKYSWSDLSSLQIASNLIVPTGTTLLPYTVTVTDDNGCTITKTANLTQPTQLQLIVNDSSISCFGFTNGALKAQPSGGTQGYLYNWSSGSALQIATNLSVTGTNYSVTVTDAKGCTIIKTANITQPTQLNLTVNDSSISCYGDINGALKAQPSGGSMGYLYNWSSGSTLQMPNTLTVTGISSNYAVTVTDAKGCSIIKSANLSQPTQMQLIVNDSSINCNGAPGALKAQPSGGKVAGIYKYFWSNLSSLQIASNLIISSGTSSLPYTVTVTDDNGCTITKTATLTQPTALNLIVNDSSISCFGGTNGALKAQPSGGTQGYLYNWSSGSALQTATNLSVTGTNYSVTVTDAKGCKLIKTANLTQPAQLNLTVNDSSISCYGYTNGALKAQPSGGSMGYLYNWTSGSTLQMPNTLSVTGITTNYVVTVTDAKGCSISKTANLTQPTQLQLIVNDSSISCFGFTNGVLKAQPSGGTKAYLYNWSSGSALQNATNLSVTGTNYSVTVTDAKGCTISKSANLTQPTQLYFNKFPPTTPSKCSAYNGSITLPNPLAIGGNNATYTPTWAASADPKDIVPTAVKSGSFSLTVTDANSCIHDTVITVSSIISVQIQTGVTKNPSCFGKADGEVYVDVVGGLANYTYTWSNQATGAAIQTTTNNTVHDVLTVSYGLTGIYYITVMDANNCQQSSTVSITQPSQFKVTASGTNPKCFNSSDGEVSATFVGGSLAPGFPVYTWNDPANLVPASLTNLPALTTGTTYTVTATDANGCTDIDSHVLTAPTDMVVSNLVADRDSCGKGLGRLTVPMVTGGTKISLVNYNYSWSNGSGNLPSASNLKDNTYKVTVTDANSCAKVVSGIVISTPLVLIDSIATTNVGCNGNPGHDGTATVYVHPGSGTPGIGGYTYQWDLLTGFQTSAKAISLDSKDYTITVSDSYKCFDVKTKKVGLNDAPRFTNVPTNDHCNSGNGAIELTIENPQPSYQIVWSANVGGQTGSKIVGLKSANGPYTVFIHDQLANCNSLPQTIKIASPAIVKADFNFSPSPADITDPNINFYDQSSMATVHYYHWDFGDYDSSTLKNPVHSYAEEGTYNVNLMVEDMNGCKDTIQKIVTINGVLTFWVANAFTPNGDGTNELWMPKGTNVDETAYSLKVFDRWGSQIFSTNDLHEGWNGRINNIVDRTVQQDTYVYIARFKDINGTNFIYKGKVTVIK